MGCILGMVLSFAQLISTPFTIAASIHMTVTASSVCRGSAHLDAEASAPQTSSELKYYVLFWAFSTGELPLLFVCLVRHIQATSRTVSAWPVDA
jgi:hypothetical protein